MIAEIKYQVKNGFLDLSFFWKQGTLSFTDTNVIINGVCDYTIPFADITRISRYLPRVGAGLFIIFKTKEETFHIRVPNSTFLVSTTNSDTERLYQKLKSRIGNRIESD